MEYSQFFTQLWNEYVKITPQAEKIHALFQEHGETIVNDHIALRTFDIAPIAIEQLSPLLVRLGYRRFDSYKFPGKNLLAESYVPENGTAPRIFISELITDSLSLDNQKRVQSYCQQISQSDLNTVDVFTRGRLWSMPDWQDYQALLQESDYAAWLSVMGLRANHFTISVNHLKKFNSLVKVNRLLLDSGFKLNQSGGLIKGSPEQLLEQSSTLADHILNRFANNDRHEITSCYYEFAKRYRDKNNQLFQGFIAQSADKIFESTDS